MASKKSGTAARRKPATTRKKATRKTAAKTARTKERKLRVKQIRSGVGRAATYRRTLRALGLRHHQAEVVVPDNPSIKGMLHKVRHLVRVKAEEA